MDWNIMKRSQQFDQNVEDPENPSPPVDPTQTYQAPPDPSSLLDEKIKQDYLSDQWKKKQAQFDSSIQSAKSDRDNGVIADAYGGGLADIANSLRKPVRLQNRMQDLGKAHQTLDADQTKWNSLEPFFDKRLGEAKQDKKDSFTDLQQGMAAKQMGQQELKDDPNSAVSKQATLMYQSALLAKAREAQEANDTESANAIKDMARNAGSMSAADAAAGIGNIKGMDWKDVLMSQDAKAKNEAHSQDVALTNQMRADSRREANQARQEAKSDRDQARSTSQQLQAFNSTQSKFEALRQDPAARQAEMDLYNSKKAEGLTKLYPDPDKMSPQQVHLLISEVAKIASGGVPTHSEMDALTPNTLESRFAGVLSKLQSDPSPANAGSFIKEYQNYLKELQTGAQHEILDRYGRLLETNKGLMSEDQYNTLKQNYLGRFGINGEAPAEGSKPASQPASSPAAKPAWAK